MAITVNKATLARQVNGELEYIYPKTDSELVRYDSEKNVKEKIDSISSDVSTINVNKLDKPVDDNGDITAGIPGQVLETNGDGTASWVTRVRVYVGSEDLPEGYDIKIDPDKLNTEIDTELNKEGAAADAKATGKAIDGLEGSIGILENAIEKMNTGVQDRLDYKVDKPVDSTGNTTNGEIGQVLETNGDGTTSWVTRARVYVGGDEMPEGYDVQIDPEAEVLEVDRTLSVDGAIAESSAVGAAVKLTREKITSGIETHNTDAAAHVDIRAMITDAKDYILLRDTVTGEEVKLTIENGTVKITSAVAKPISLTITSNPTKTSYDVNDKFNPNGMVVTVNYNDGTSKVVTDYTYPTTAISAGTTAITITYIEAGVTVTANVAITVVVKCIGISVTTQPTNTVYYIGETFNTAGMIVAATYSDGTIKAITNYTYPTTALTASTTTVAISYVESGTTFTANVPITVIAKYTGIGITTQPTKTSYTEGQVFDPTGMVVTASYNNGTTKTVTGYTYSTAALTAGATYITIIYTENGLTYTANVAITVAAVFDAATVLRDFNYTTNADGTYTITGWKGTLNGVASTEIIVPDSKYVVVNPSA